MNINEAYPSEYIKAADLKGREWPVTISHVTTEKLGDDIKPVLYFQGAEKGLALNKTNGMTIASYYGPETDAWAGKPLILYPTKVPFQGQLTDAIRVRAPAEGSTIPEGNGTFTAPAPQNVSQGFARPEGHPNVPGNESANFKPDSDVPF